MSRFRSLAAIQISLILIAVFFLSPGVGGAKAASSLALTGVVTSQEEGPMEGVLVSARRDGATFTVTVVSDTHGRYSFPRERLEPGKYSLRIRAVGYDLDDPGSFELTPTKTAQIDLKLLKAKDLASQLSNTEWFMSWPGRKEQKMVFSECIQCHTLERIARSRYTGSEFQEVVKRMSGWAPGSNPSNPVKRLHMRPEAHPMSSADTDYLSSVNLSATPEWKYALKTLPRPKGRATRVIITEYDLPRRPVSAHDVVMGPNGNVWYADYGKQFIGKLDPKTGKVAEYPVPSLKQGYDNGILNLEVDSQENVWLAMFYHVGLAKFDPHSEKFQTWGAPSSMNDVRATAFFAPLNNGVDGKVWMGGGYYKQFRVDLQSGQWEALDEKRDLPKDSEAASDLHGAYGLSSDYENNLYEFDIVGGYIIKVNAKTLKATYYKTPTANSGPRRGHMDSNDRLWFAEHVANKIGMFDTKTKKFEEWEVPIPFTNPYDAISDKNGEVWTGGMASDRVVRLNPKTGNMTEYLLPRATNIRRVSVDNSTTPVTFWVGNTDLASIVKVEPLD